MSRATLRSKGQITLPVDVREALRLEEGDNVEFAIGDDGRVTLVGTTTIPTDQRWFWTAQWQAGEREASAGLSRGEGRIFESDESFLASFDDTNR